MIKYIAAAFVLVIAAVLIYAAMQSDDFRVQRVARIKAPADKIFAEIVDFHKWGAWSPYEKLDPAMKRTYEGAAEGQGAIYSWQSSGQAGTGRMEIAGTTAPTEAGAPAKVSIKLDFLKPFEAHNMAEFTLVPKDDTVEVTWAMYGPRPFVSKLMGLFFNMDQMIGKDFETGLTNLAVAARG